MTTDHKDEPDGGEGSTVPLPDWMGRLPDMAGGFPRGELILFQAQSRVGRSRINPADVVISVVTKRDIDNAVLSLRMAKKRPPSPDTVVIDSYSWTTEGKTRLDEPPPNYPITLSTYGLVDDNGMPKPEDQTSERETK